MPTIVDRDHAVQLLHEEFDALAALGAGLTEAQWKTPTCLAGWTVQDQLAHLAGIEAMLAGDPQPVVEVPAYDYLRNDIARANEAWIEPFRAGPGAAVLERFVEVTARRLAALDAMTQADFDAPSWTPAGPNETYGRFMRIRHYDCYFHEHDMRAALAVPDRDDAAHVASALDETEPAVGFIAGKRAELPAGARVRVELTGPAAREWNIAVDERAALVPTLDRAADAVITMPSMLVLRLTGGREPAAPHLASGAVTITGDRALGEQLVTNLGYTI